METAQLAVTIVSNVILSHHATPDYQDTGSVAKAPVLNAQCLAENAKMSLNAFNATMVLV
jgi:hypothetical protein